MEQVYYVFQEGDTLQKVSDKTGVSVGGLVALNPIFLHHPRDFQVGMKIKTKFRVTNSNTNIVDTNRLSEEKATTTDSSTDSSSTTCKEICRPTWRHVDPEVEAERSQFLWPDDVIEIRCDIFGSYPGDRMKIQLLELESRPEKPFMTAIVTVENHSVTLSYEVKNLPEEIVDYGLGNLFLRVVSVEDETIYSENVVIFVQDTYDAYVISTFPENPCEYEVRGRLSREQKQRNQNTSDLFEVDNDSFDESLAVRVMRNDVRKLKSAGMRTKFIRQATAEQLQMVFSDFRAFSIYLMGHGHGDASIDFSEIETNTFNDDGSLSSGARFTVKQARDYRNERLSQFSNLSSNLEYLVLMSCSMGRGGHAWAAMMNIASDNTYYYYSKDSDESSDVVNDDYTTYPNIMAWDDPVSLACLDLYCSDGESIDHPRKSIINIYGYTLLEGYTERIADEFEARN